MPGDLNRVLLNGTVSLEPVQRGKSVCFMVTTTDRWTTAAGQKRFKMADHQIVAVYPALATYALKLRIGDRVFVEGAAEHPNVVLGAMHSSLMLLRPSTEAAEEPEPDDLAS